MSKLFCLFLSISSLFNLHSQDTIINGHVVEIVGLKFNKKISYSFITNYKIKDGFYREEIGKLIVSGNYVDNQKHGEFLLKKNDTIFEKKTYKKGQLNGQYFFRNLSYSENGCYRKNIRIGKWKYKRNQTLICKGKYRGVLFLKPDGNTDLFIFSTGDTIYYPKAKTMDFAKKYDYFIEQAHTDLRSGRWVFFDEFGKKSLVVKYNKLGQVKKKKTHGYIDEELLKKYYNLPL